jgi:hypothetical protein
MHVPCVQTNAAASGLANFLYGANHCRHRKRKCSGKVSRIDGIHGGAARKEYQSAPGRGEGSKRTEYLASGKIIL